MQYLVRHRTVYHYPDKVAESHHLARLRPLDDGGQRCLRHVLTIDPAPGVREERQDAFGNPFVFFAQQAAYDVLCVEAVSLVETSSGRVTDLEASPPWEEVVDLLAEDAAAVHLEAQPFRWPTAQVPVGDAMADYARLSFTPGCPLLSAARDLTGRIFRDFRFDPLATTVSTPVETVLKQKRGVCQDFAHLAIACMRSLGLAVRYVSGYLETAPPPGKPRLVGADASHAWISVYCPRSGWVDFDPTNNCIPGHRHLRLARGRDYADVSPLRGVTFGGGGQQPKVMVDVIPQEEGKAPTGVAAMISGIMDNAAASAAGGRQVVEPSRR
ncbi:MAG: transglutaminase domain protein [Verrucomicrobiales bacterium]|nr:transglutaminase domain protein [Verrucomicrobiales bacterium]